ncbi:V-type ATP synthase subunit I [Candidatus Weimeria sp. HCP3S3_B5]|uniref:V-type ATP synthase subunit I n=1 Tax=Candidatus Weimeria sp. HCP3S3_B5 TaxID=3438871 RepID=UPI003F89894F
MAVMPMKRMTIIAMRRDRKQLLEFLQRQGTAEIDTDTEEDGRYKKIDVSAQKQIFEKNIHSMEDALEVLERFDPQKKGLLSSLEGRKTLTVEEFGRALTKRDEVLETVSCINSLYREYAQSLAAVPKAQMDKEALYPWKDFDLPLDFTGTRLTTSFIGTLTGRTNLEEIYVCLGELCDFSDQVDVRIISADDTSTAVMFTTLRTHERELSEVLHRMNFTKAPSQSRAVEDGVSLAPAKAIERIDAQMQRASARRQQLVSEIKGYGDRRDDIRLIIDYFRMRSDKYDVIGKLNQSDHVVIIHGYVPEADYSKLSRALEARFDLACEFCDPAPDEDVPVKLRNNAFASPVEGVVKSYSLPGKDEIDPSMPVSLFYYIFFGLMLSDAAYGIIIATVCGVLLKKFKNMEEGMKRTFQMFFYCGIATTVVGFIFGSFFGDVVSSVAQTFFNVPKDAAARLLPPIWFNPLDDPIKMLTFCFAVGLIHLFTGLGILMYQDIKNGKPRDAVYDGLFWYMFVGGCVVLLLCLPMITGMLGLTFTLGAGVKKISSIVAIIGFTGIVLFAGRDSKNWGKRLAKGLYGAYGITSYLSDVLSYSRLLALGLATSVISSVFNTMAGMVGGAMPVVAGVIMYALIFVIGHILNLAINALGAYVHTNRLQYVEFFGKFYNGGGREFTPFEEKTKYYKVKEEI